MKVGRNERCPCGSGQKFKRCHGSPSPPPLTAATRLHGKNRLLLTGIADIFGAQDWNGLREKVTAERVRALYEYVMALWPPGTNIQEVLPAPNNRLRALYLGEPEPDLLARSVLRASLYADEIYVVNPFHFPLGMADELNPLTHPDKYRLDTLKLLWFIVHLEEWILSGLITLIPDPMLFDPVLRDESFASVTRRSESFQITDEEAEEAVEDGRELMARFLSGSPRPYVENMLRVSHPEWPADKIDRLVNYIHSHAERDPLAFPPEQGFEEARTFTFSRSGTNSEVALFISSATGAFPVTNMRSKWNDLMLFSDKMNEVSRVWSPLSQAFQSLTFKFMNNVDPNFALRIRQEERLEGLRRFLNKVWQEVKGEPSIDKAERLALDFTDELQDEYKKALEDWNKIDRGIVSWSGAAISGGMVGGDAILSGHLNPWLGAASAVLALSTTVYGSTRARKEFRAKNPMSVFIDLSKHKPKR